MGTLESRVSKRIAELAERDVPARRAALREARRAGAPRDWLEQEEREVSRLEDEETKYLLDIMPFVREYTTEHEGTQTKAPGKLANFVTVTQKSKKNNVLQRYMLHVERQVDADTVGAAIAHENSTQKHNPNDAEFFCKECDGYMVYHTRESMLVCGECGVCQPYIAMNSSNLTYEQEVNMDVNTTFSYKRHNHFSELLNALQAKVGLFFCRAYHATALDPGDAGGCDGGVDPP